MQEQLTNLPRPSVLRRLAASLAFPLASKKIDVVVLGYPKTGNTWLTMLLRKLLVSHFKMPEHRIADILPDSVRALLRANTKPAPLIYVTHHMTGYHQIPANKMHLSFAPFRTKKAIFLIRDPRDTLVSLYMHAKHREGWYQKDIESFVFDEFFGIEKYLAFYRQLYESAALFEDFSIVRYEDLHGDISQTLSRISSFCGIGDVDLSTLQNAIEYGSMSSMRKIEQGGRSAWWAMKPPPNLSDPNALKVREGKVGGFKQHLQESTVEKIDRLVQQNLPAEFGYGHP